MKKLIGITTSKSKTQNFLNQSYVKAFTTENTTPIMIPNIFELKNEIISKEQKEDIQKHVEMIESKLDALIISGGSDVNPVILNKKITDSSSFSYNRDYIEVELIKLFIKKNKPILGICKGFQLLGNILGLNYFHQDLSFTDEIHAGPRCDVQTRKEPMHRVHLFGNFKKYCEEKGLEKNGKLLTNSFHHQGFTYMPDGEYVTNVEIEDFVTGKVDFHLEKTKTIINNYKDLEITMGTNKVIEGFTHKKYPIVAFQNHPEEYENSLAINYFLENFINN